MLLIFVVMMVLKKFGSVFSHMYLHLLFRYKGSNKLKSVLAVYVLHYKSQVMVYNTSQPW